MHDDDEYVPESEQIARLRSEIAVLQSRMDAMERELEAIRAMDLHTKVAVLTARIDALEANRKTVAARLDALLVLVLGIGVVSTTTLTVTLRIFFGLP